MQSHKSGTLELWLELCRTVFSLGGKYDRGPEVGSTRTRRPQGRKKRPDGMAQCLWPTRGTVLRSTLFQVIGPRVGGPPGSSSHLVLGVWFLTHGLERLCPSHRVISSLALG